MGARIVLARVRLHLGEPDGDPRAAKRADQVGAQEQRRRCHAGRAENVDRKRLRHRTELMGDAWATVA